MKKLLVIGSLNMDMVVRLFAIPKTGETVTGMDIKYLPGGKGANQACAIAKLGGCVTMAGAVGNDDYANTLIDNLKGAGVDMTCINRVNKNSGLALIYVGDKGENSIVVLPGANHCVKTDYIDEITDYIHKADWVILQMEIPEATVEYAIRKAHSLGKKVLLNPAPAPDGYPDDIYGMVDIITPNETELEKLTKMPVDTMEEIFLAAKELRVRGTKQIVVTCGAKGALLINSEGHYLSPAPDFKAVDTTAAGDTFTGALVVALSEGKDIKEAMSFANSAAGISVTRWGAQASIPTREEVDDEIRRRSV